MEAFLQGESVKSVGVAAMLLALTRTLKDEEKKSEHRAVL